MRNEGSPLEPKACEGLPDGGAWLNFILISLFFNDLHSKSRKRLYYLRVEISVWSERNMRPCGGKKCLWRNFSKNHFGAKSVPKTVPEIFGTNSSKNRGTKTHITH